MARALEAYATGFDFADALHLAFAGAADSFATFDTRLARRYGGMKVITP
jgi:predicted nucleic acid-binding protein